MLEYRFPILSRRTWFVPDFTVWGEPSLAEHEFLALAKIDATWSIYYGAASIGQNVQEVLYAQLTDHRGNNLPVTIDAPRVFVRPKNADATFVLGEEADDRFKIAHESGVEGPVVVDLWVIELGA
jgi:hypothetical protein